MISVNIQNLGKQYGTVVALDDVSLKINAGSVWGLIGPNGSGKTTLLSILAGLITPTKGSFFLDNKETLGAIIETPCFYGHLTGEQNLAVVAQSRHLNINIINDVLKTVRLEAQRNKRYSNYSLGMKQRLGIAAALIGSPRILLLDEPTNGLDPVGICEMRELITSLAVAGHSLILASHLLSEIDQVCTHIALLKEGKLIFKGDRETFVGQDSIENAFLNTIR